MGEKKEGEGEMGTATTGSKKLGRECLQRRCRVRVAVECALGNPALETCIP